MDVGFQPVARLSSPGHSRWGDQRNGMEFARQSRNAGARRSAMPQHAIQMSLLQRCHRDPVRSGRLRRAQSQDGSGFRRVLLHLRRLRGYPHRRANTSLAVRDEERGVPKNGMIAQTGGNQRYRQCNPPVSGGTLLRFKTQSASAPRSSRSWRRDSSDRRRIADCRPPRARNRA
jgi:hypothetical protein